MGPVGDFLESSFNIFQPFPSLWMKRREREYVKAHSLRSTLYGRLAAIHQAFHALHTGVREIGHCLEKWWRKISSLWRLIDILQWSTIDGEWCWLMVDAGAIAGWMVVDHWWWMIHDSSGVFIMMTNYLMDDDEHCRQFHFMMLHSSHIFFLAWKLSWELHKV